MNSPMYIYPHDGGNNNSTHGTTGKFQLLGNVLP